MNNPTAVVVGRHAPVGLDKVFDIIATANVLYPVEPNAVLNELQDVVLEHADADVLALQNVPTPLGGVFLLMQRCGLQPRMGGMYLPEELGTNVALVIARPERAETLIEKRFRIGTGDAAEAAMAAILAANPRAKVHVDGMDVVITVEPPRRFVLNSIILFPRDPREEAMRYYAPKGVWLPYSFTEGEGAA